MIQSKLFVLKQEIELLWTEMTYERSAKPNGKPSSNVQGGLITVCFETTPKTDIILRWMTKDSLDDSLMELDKMEEGKVCFYADGYDYPPSKTYNFKDAFLVDYQQIFDSSNSAPMQSMITISPAIQNYGADVIKPWNINYVPPSEEAPYEAEENVDNDERILECYYTDLNGDKNAEPQTGDKVYLVLATQNLIGKTIDIDLSSNSKDFIYNGKVLENDIIPDFNVTANTHKIKLEIVAPQPEPINAD